MPKRTLRSLTKEIHFHAQESAAVSVRLGGTVYFLTGLYVGTVAGKEFGALILGDRTLFLKIDRNGTMRHAKVLESPDLEALSKDLLPEPPEVIAANKALAALPKLPRGYRYAIDGKGDLVVVEEGGKAGGGGSKPVESKKDPIESEARKVGKPLIVKGLRVKRLKTGIEHVVSSIDAATGFIVLKPTDGSADYRTKALMGNGSTKTAPSFWRFFECV